MLSEPATYFPIRGGRYDVAPALRPFGNPFGNGDADARMFQLDNRFPEYRANKLGCRSDRPGKHTGVADLRPGVARSVLALILDRLVDEYPGVFSRQAAPDGGCVLECRHTCERLVFDSALRLLNVEGGVPYADALDALACQVQEDLAVVCEDRDGRDRLAAYHICAPSHWIPEEKAGRDFAAIHETVPGMEVVNRVAATMVDAMIRRGPFVRFVWGIDTDRRLNRHPQAPSGVPPDAWQSPPFDPSRSSPFVFRVERQVVWGLPEAAAALFLIRPYLTEGAEVCRNPVRRSALHSALSGMSAESRRYKGIAGYADALIQWLEREPA